jgi:hypothetical protein
MSSFSGSIFLPLLSLSLISLSLCLPVSTTLPVHCLAPWSTSRLTPEPLVILVASRPSGPGGHRVPL